MAKGRQPPKAAAKKTTQSIAQAIRKMGSEALARNQAVIKEVNAGIARSQARSRAVQKEADEAVARADKLSEEYEAFRRELSQRTRQRDLYITTALAAGLGGLAIYEVGRHTYQNIQRKQAAAQRAERDHRVARARGLRDLTQAQQAEEVATARRMHRIPTPLSLFDIREPYTREEILTAVATRERPHTREAATLLLNNQEL